MIITMSHADNPLQGAIITDIIIMIIMMVVLIIMIIMIIIMMMTPGMSLTDSHAPLPSCQLILH